MTSTCKRSILMDLGTLWCLSIFLRENTIIFYRDSKNKYAVMNEDCEPASFKDSMGLYSP